MRYYGGKDKLLDFIEIGIKKTELNHGAKFVDLFTSTTVIAQYFKKKGYTVIANDFLEFDKNKFVRVAKWNFARNAIEIDSIIPPLWNL